MKKQIEISLEKIREQYNDPEAGSTFKAMLLENFSKEQLEKKQLPKSWEELKTVEEFNQTCSSGSFSFDKVWNEHKKK